MSKPVTLNLRLKTTSFPVFNIIGYIRLLPGVIKAEQVFPDENDPRLAAMYLVKVEASHANDVIESLKLKPDVKSVQVAPLRKAQKRKKR